MDKTIAFLVFATLISLLESGSQNMMEQTLIILMISFITLVVLKLGAGNVLPLFINEDASTMNQDDEMFP